MLNCWVDNSLMEFNRSTIGLPLMGIFGKWNKRDSKNTLCDSYDVSVSADSSLALQDHHSRRERTLFQCRRPSCLDRVRGIGFDGLALYMDHSKIVKYRNENKKHESKHGIKSEIKSEWTHFSRDYGFFCVLKLREVILIRYSGRYCSLSFNHFDNGLMQWSSTAPNMLIRFLTNKYFSLHINLRWKIPAGKRSSEM